MFIHDPARSFNVCGGEAPVDCQRGPKSPLIQLFFRYTWNIEILHICWIDTAQSSLLTVESFSFLCVLIGCHSSNLPWDITTGNSTHLHYRLNMAQPLRVLSNEFVRVTTGDGGTRFADVSEVHSSQRSPFFYLDEVLWRLKQYDYGKFGYWPNGIQRVEFLFVPSSRYMQRIPGQKIKHVESDWGSKRLWPLDTIVMICGVCGSWNAQQA